MMALIIGAIHGLVVYTSGILTKSKFVLIIVAILAGFFAFATGNPAYAGFDIVMIVIGVYVGWVEISQQSPSARKKENIQRKLYWFEEEGASDKILKIVIKLAICFAIIIVFINKSRTNNQPSFARSVESTDTKRPVQIEPKPATNLNSSATLKENQVRKNKRVEVKVTNKNSSGNCYTLKTDREILNCLDSQ